jgi:hypothetical protein
MAPETIADVERYREVAAQAGRQEARPADEAQADEDEREEDATGEPEENS